MSNCCTKYPESTAANDSAIAVTDGLYTVAVGQGALKLNANLSFDASRNNNIYSNSECVYPESLKIVFFIKY